MLEANNNYITVSVLNTYVSSIIKGDQKLQRLYIIGEISGGKLHVASGNYYFDLKDEQSTINCVIYKSDYSKVKFQLENGLKVLCFGSVSLYPKTGRYQLIVRSIKPDGIGDLNLAFEQLKRILQKEGIFDSAHKKQLPRYPKKVGVATSKSGAALQDIINVCNRRYPLTEIVYVDTLVQGDSAIEDIVKSIQLLDSSDVDVIIVGRGGGSQDDLWCFNSELVVRAIYNCNTPIVSAVGHETDTTLSDFASDRRAPTPSAAAELVCPDKYSEVNKINDFVSVLNSSINRNILYRENHLNVLSNSPVLLDVSNVFKKYDSIIENFKLSLNSIINLKINGYDSNIKLLDNNLNSKFEFKFNSIEMKFDRILKSLSALNPYNVLEKGYALIQKDNKIINSVSLLNANDSIILNFKDGKATAIVKEVENNE